MWSAAVEGLCAAKYEQQIGDESEVKQAKKKSYKSNIFFDNRFVWMNVNSGA